MRVSRQGVIRVLRDAWGRLFGERVVARADTYFGLATVRDLTWEGERMRVLEVDGTFQSATYLDDRYCALPFPYLRLFGHIFDLDPAPKDLLMLGGGALAFPKYAIARSDAVRVDVVEIDPTVLELARAHFFLDRLERDFRALSSGRLTILNEDGRAFLERCYREGAYYDAILIDCFCAADVETSLQGPMAFSLAHGCLRPQGVLVLNVISALEGPDAGPLDQTNAALSQSFAHAVVLSEGRLEADMADNRCVVASDEKICLRGQVSLF